MNFHKTELEQCSLSTGAINILVLASEWFRCKEDAYKKTDILLLLLCGIHEVSKQNVRKDGLYFRWRYKG